MSVYRNPDSQVGREMRELEHQFRLNERLGAEFIAGAEAEWRERTGRPITRGELERMLQRYPGDLPVPGRRSE